MRACVQLLTGPTDTGRRGHDAIYACLVGYRIAEDHP